MCVYVPEICMNFVIDGTIDRSGGGGGSGSGGGGGDDDDYNKQMSEQNTNK